MRIGFLHQPYDPYTSIRMKYFVSQRHEVYSITFPKKNVKPKKIQGVINILLPEIFINRIFLIKRLVYIWHINRITKKFKLDILHVVNAESMVLSIFSASKKIIIENQGSDVLRAPIIYPWLKYIYRFFYKYTDAVIQDSKIAQDAGLHYGAPTACNEVIEIGIDFTIFNDKVIKGKARKKLGIKNDDLIVFSSRGMKEVYNIDIIIKSIPKVKIQFPNVKFVFAANIGDFSENIKSFIDNCDLNDNILFTGWLDHENEMPFFNRDADVVLSVPSSDSSPFSVYEAMATKTPVIVSDLPWLKNKFIPNVDLMIVPVRDEEALSSKIVQVLKNKNVLNLESAYNIVYNKINMVKENNRLEILYNQLLYE